MIKVIKVYPDGRVEAVIKKGSTFRYEPGDFVELGFKDYRVISVYDNGNEPVYELKSVV